MKNTIGNTPLIRLLGIEKYMGLSARLFAKIERGNLTGSVKDRPALFMLRDYEKGGILTKGGRIVEATSGNMGISLSALASRGGYRALIVMPRSASYERRKIIRALGAELVLTDGGMAEAVALKDAICKTEGAIPFNQFENPMNVYAHEKTTGPEIYRALGGGVDIFLAGVGTGGTVSGVGRYLKAKNPLIKILAIEPKESPVISGGEPKTHRIQGIGAGFMPTILDKNVINGVKTVSFEESIEGVKILASREGLLCGISSGAAVMAAISVGLEEKNHGKSIVTLLPDGMEKYLTT